MTRIVVPYQASPIISSVNNAIGLKVTAVVRALVPKLLPALLAAVISVPAFAAYTKQDTAQLYEQALIQLDQDQPNSAEIHLKNALQADPAFLAGHVLLGQTYLSQNRPALAQKQLERGLELGADPALIFQPLADALLAQKKFYPLLDVIYPGNFSSELNASLLVYRGRAYFELAQYDQAELAFQDAAKTDPGNLNALMGQARIHLSRGNFESSGTLAQQALRTDASNAEVWYLLGLIAHAQNNFQLALSNYNKASALDPNHYQAKLSRIGIYVDSYQNQLALDELVELHELAPYDPQAAYMLSEAYRRSGDLEQAKTVLNQAREILESIPQEVTDSHGPSLLLSGLIYYDLQQWQKAISQLDIYQKAYPSAPSVGKLLGAAHLKLGDLNRAIDSLEKARKSNPDDFLLLSMLGDAYLKKNKHYKASVAFQQALNVAPTSSETGTGLALSLIGMGDTQKGMEVLARTFSQSPEANEAGVILAISLLKDRRYQQAIPVAETLLAKAPDNLILQNLLASAYIATGDRQSARQMYLQIIELQPDFLPSLINLIKLDRIEGRNASAQQRLEQLRVEYPTNTLLMLESARIEQQLGNSEQALAWLLKAHSIDSNDTKVGSYLVDLYLQQESTDKALKLAQELSTDNPDDWLATKSLAKALIRSGKTASAQAELKQLSLLSGFDAQRLTATTRLQLQAQDVAGAIYSLSKALKSEPDNIALRARYGSLLLQTQRLEELEQELIYLRNAQPAHPLTLVLEGDLLASQGQYSAAMANYQQAIAQTPQSSTALKIHQLYLSTQQPEQSMQFLQQWHQQYPQDLAVNEVLAQGYLHQGQQQQALELYEQLLQQGVRSPSVLNNLANLYLRSKDPRALTLAQEAHRLSPDSAITNDTLGWVMVQQGDLVNGLQHLRNASVRSANDPEILYHIAEALIRLDRTSEGKRTLEKALSIEHQFEGIDQARMLQIRLAQ